MGIVCVTFTASHNGLSGSLGRESSPAIHCSASAASRILAVSFHETGTLGMVVWIRMPLPLWVHMFQCLVTRKWHYLRGIRTCGLVGVGEAFLEKCVTEGGLWGSNAKAGLSVCLSFLFLLPMDPCVELSANLQDHGFLCATTFPATVTVD